MLVLGAGVCWSTMGLGIRAMESANVWQILFYRSVALAPFLFVVIALRGGHGPVEAIRRAGLAGVFGGACLVLAFAGGIFAFQATTIANAAFLFATAPFFAALLGKAILGESVRPATWAAMAAAALGIAIMVAEGIALGHLLGNVAAIASAFGFALFTVTLRWKKLDDMLPSVFLGGVFAALIAAAVCFLAGYGLAIPGNDIAVSAAMGVFQVGAGLALFTIGSRVVPAVELAFLSMTEVLLAPFWVWLFLGEVAGFQTLTGGAILLAAIAANAVSSLRRKPAPVM